MKEKLTRLLANRLFVCMLLCIYCLSGYQHTVCANNYRAGSQNILKTNVSLESSSATLKEVLNQLSGKSKVKFIYSENDIRGVVYDHLEFKDQPLDEVLEAILSPHKLTYTQMNDRVIVRQAQQPGGVRGKVYDAESGETLVGASIVVEGTTKGTTTDMDGKYTLSGLEPGNYTFVVSFVSYQKKKFTNIRITSGNNTLLDVPLNPATENIAEVEVVGRIDVKTAPIRNTDEVSMISNIRTSDLMVTGISSEQISKSLDRDASEVLKRAPGITLQNNFVVIRGLAPRYTQTYLNGMPMNSTESFQRAFSFDIIPSGIIDNITINRSPAPELSGGFGGGIVNVGTRQGQTARRIQLSVSGEYDTDNSFTDLNTGSNDTHKDWYGGGSDDRDFIKDLKGLPKYDLYPEERIAQLKTMRPVNDLERTNHSLNRSIGINYFDSWKIGNVRLNNLTSFNYSYKREAYTSYHYHYSSILEDGRIDGGIERRDSISNEKVRLNVLEAFNVEINKNHKIKVDFFANRNAVDANAISPYASYGTTAVRLNDSIPKDVQVMYMYRTDDLFSGRISGEHTLGRHNIQWGYGHSKFKSYTPDIEIFDFHYSVKKGGHYYFDLISDNGGSDGTMSRSNITIEEKGDNANLDYVFNLNPNSKLKAGAAYSSQDRTSNARDYMWQSKEGNGYYDELNSMTPWNNLSETLTATIYDYDAVSVDFVNQTNQNNSYEYKNEIMAGYLAWKQGFFNQKLDLYGGVRYERENVRLYDQNGELLDKFYTYVDGVRTLMIDMDGPVINHWLPSLYATWNINENQKLRAGYGKTLDRPFARERSKSLFKAVDEGLVYIGSPVLQNAKLDNVDLRWEIYPNSGGFLALGAFYKHIKNPIENQVNEGEKSTKVVPVNFRKADLYGGEIEIRKNLGFIPVSWADRFSVIANASYTYTRVKNECFSRLSLVWGNGSGGDDHRPLSGTAPFLANFNLYYTAPRWKTKLAANYTYTGEMLYALGEAEYGALYKDAYHQLDLTAIQPLGRYMTVKAGVKNLFKQDITGWRDKDFDGEKRIGVEVPYRDGPYTTADIGNALRISTLRIIYLSLQVSF